MIDQQLIHLDFASPSHQPNKRPPSLATTAPQTTMMTSEPQSRPPILGIHHLKFAVSNLDVSLAWYERVLGAKRIPHLDHIRWISGTHTDGPRTDETSGGGTRFAAVVSMPSWNGLFLELRHAPDQARRERGWDTVTLQVQGRRELEAWMAWLRRWGTVCSPLLAGVRGWVVVFEVGVLSS